MNRPRGVPRPKSLGLAGTGTGTRVDRGEPRGWGVSVPTSVSLRDWDSGTVTPTQEKQEPVPPFRDDGTMRSRTHTFHFRRIFHGG